MYQHSFPTRRSSDLVDIDEADNAIHAHILEGNDVEEYTQELYSGEDSIGYQTEGDSEWFKFDVGDVPVTEGFTSAYDKITALIESIEDELEEIGRASCRERGRILGRAGGGESHMRGAEKG